MAGQISSIKRQIKSVKSTQKLTNALALVSTAKLQKEKGKMAANIQYAKEYTDLLNDVIASKNFLSTDNIFFNDNLANNPLHIIITSNSGLCGTYNVDLLKYVSKTIKKDEPVFAIGSYGIKWLKNNGYAVVKEFEELDNLNAKIVNMIVDMIMTLYEHNEISSVDIIYTKYINTLTFNPAILSLLPINKKDSEDGSELLLEPDSSAVIKQLIDGYISSQLYATYLESKTSEHAARRSAMDAANQNAEELIEKLKLNYNQARQAAITQEMNEITAAIAK